MRKILYVLLACCLVSVLVGTAMATEATTGTCGENLTWVLENGTLTISGTGEMEDYFYYNATPWYAHADEIQMLVIEPGVVRIGQYAFGGLENLTGVSLPEGLSVIGGNAFHACEKLTGVLFPEGLTVIGDDAFYNCTSMTTLVLPDSVTFVDSGAFSSCSGLTSITLSSSLTEVGYYVFGGCSSVTDITIPENVKSIDQSAFRDCTSLSHISIPDGVTEIGWYAFSGCTSLVNIDLPDALASIEYEAFSGCTGLTSLVIPDSVSVIGEYAFKDCTGLTEITVPGGVSTIEERAFQGCTGLRTVTVSDGVAVIKNGAFRGCTGLTGISIPASVTTLESSPFSGCSNLVEIQVDANNPVYSSDDSGVVYNKKMTQVFCVPCGISGSYSVPDGVLMINSNAFKDCRKLTGVSLPNSLVRIGTGAFSNCTGLTGIVIPDSVTRMDSDIFDGCSGLTSVKLPKHIVSIPHSTFYGCTNLTGLEIPATVADIGGAAFSYCSSLTGIVIPDGVRSLSYSTFRECTSLTDITIPASVTTIEYDAFDYSNSISVVHYTGTEAQKNAITDIYGNDFDRIKAPWHCNVLTRMVEGRKVYYCGECDRYYYADGTSVNSTIIPESKLYVSGIYVTDQNRADVLGDGTVSYDVDSNTLILNRVDITVTDEDYFICAENSLNIQLIGTNTINITNGDGIRVTNGDLKITGDKLEMNIENQTKTEVYGIFCGGNLICDGDGHEISVNASSAELGCGIYTEGDIYIIGKYMYFSARSAAQTYGIYSCKTIYHEGYSTNAWAYLSDGYEGTTTGVCANKIYVSNGKLQASGDTSFRTNTGIYTADGINVMYAAEEFVPGVTCILTTDSEAEMYGYYCTLGHTTYDISVGNTSVTSVNKNDVFGDGTVSYDPQKDILYLNNAQIQGDIWGEYGYKIHLTGENSITNVYSNDKNTYGDRIFAMGAWHGISIFGDGSLDLYLSAPVVENVYCIDIQGEVSIKDCRINILLDNVTDKQSAMGILGIGGVIIENAQINVNVQTAESKPAGYGIVSTIGDIEICDSTVSVISAKDAFYSGNFIKLHDGLEITGAAQIYHDGITGNLSPADPDVPVVIEPKAVVAPTLKGKGFTLSFEDEILVNFYYTAENMADVAQQGMLVFYGYPDEVDFAKAHEVYEGSATDSAVFMNTTTGIAAKQMGDTRYYCAYARLTDGSYVYSPLYDYSPKKYALNMLTKASASEKQKALCVAMLNYGAAAQAYFGYKTDSLMNDGLTDEQKAMVIAYDRSLFKGAISSEKATQFVKTEGFTKKSATVSFEGAFSINFYMIPEYSADGAMTLYVWTPETYAAVDSLTAENATAMTMTEKDGTFFAQVAGIASKYLDNTYYVAAVYTDANGNEYCTGVIAYSLSKYCLNNDSGSMSELAQATAMYGYCAKQYFTN